MAKNNNPVNRYERRAGNRQAVGEKRRTISFSWEKLDVTQGQSILDWENEGLLSQFCTRMQQIGQYEAPAALAQQLIKQYTQVGFPPDSKFNIPRHVTPTYWAVIHITPNSREVVAGYIDSDVFLIVFLDKFHHFWPTNIQDRGKNKR
jgi:hypothetical protein